MINIADQSFTG